MLYEPALVLVVVGTLYLATRVLHWRWKRRLLWLLVAATLSVGVAGAAYQLYTRGSISITPTE